MRRLKWAVLLVLALLLTIARAGALLPVYAEPLDDQTRQLLEKSLSLVEIDREIERIANQRSETQTSIDRMKEQLAQQELTIAVAREEAGRVLRAYYMGHRDFWLSSLLSAKSLPDLFRIWDLMDIVVSADQRKMNAYADQYDQLLAGYDQLNRNIQELDAVSSQLIAQRERVAALQQEVDAALAASDDADLLRRLMDELQAYWRNVGLYEVKQHFRALANAMQALPDWAKNTPGVLELNGLKPRITITDSQLNEFLREQDDRFDNFAFTFDDGLLTIDGDNGIIQVMIQGRYEVVNEPQNAILFHVDKLVFNGLELPDTTRAELEREFDLGFYPQKLVKYVKAQSVTMEDGALIVVLKLG